MTLPRDGVRGSSTSSVKSSRRRHLLNKRLAFALATALAAIAAGLCVGPAAISPLGAVKEVLDHVPGITINSGLSPVEAAVVWEIRFPRVVLAFLVGSMLSLSGAAYQGVFRNPLADPYLLGAAAGAGLGATIAIGLGVHAGGASSLLLPVAAFAGAMLAVMLTYAIGSDRSARTTTTLILAGVAVTSLLTALQTFLQQRQSDTIREIYSWILGRLSGASWHDIRLILPYVVLSTIVVGLHRRILDVMRVGDDEATSLGVNVARARLIVVIGASIGAAAAVAVSGLIGFVGVIVPHAIRMIFGMSYRIILPLAFVLGGAFLIIADVAARTALAPAEIPIGVVTASIGAPFFLIVMRLRREVTGI